MIILPNYHYLAYLFLWKGDGRMYFLSLGVNGLIDRDARCDPQAVVTTLTASVCTVRTHALQGNTSALSRAQMRKQINVAAKVSHCANPCTCTLPTEHILTENRTRSAIINWVALWLRDPGICTWCHFRWSAFVAMTMQFGESWDEISSVGGQLARNFGCDKSVEDEAKTLVLTTNERETNYKLKLPLNDSVKSSSSQDRQQLSALAASNFFRLNRRTTRKLFPSVDKLWLLLLHVFRERENMEWCGGLVRGRGCTYGFHQVPGRRRLHRRTPRGRRGLEWPIARARGTGPGWMTAPRSPIRTGTPESRTEEPPRTMEWSGRGENGTTWAPTILITETCSIFARGRDKDDSSLAKLC